ncbi:hypothetical protein [Rudaea sp.]|uniref:hypothetical protein n=1 Tax=Rudaea sp. TaxID=2136325 RepID=UPI0037851F2C
MYQLETRAVAFLDILGFSDLTAQAEKEIVAQEKFEGLKTVIDSHVRWDNDRISSAVPDILKPSYLFISDSIILSVPMTSQKYDGLLIVAIKSIEIAHKVLEMGFLLRGGIAIGNVRHEPKNIFGTGYIEAYKLEQVVSAPRIVLSEEAEAHMRTATSSNSPLKDHGIWIEEDEHVRLDTLHPHYIRDIHQHGRIEHAFGQYRAHISMSLGHRDAKARGKWRAMRAQFNRALDLHRIDVTPIK